jgi:hypothetical protein
MQRQAPGLVGLGLRSFLVIRGCGWRKLRAPIRKEGSKKGKAVSQYDLLSNDPTACVWSPRARCTSKILGLKHAVGRRLKRQIGRSRGLTVLTLEDKNQDC